MRGGGCAPVRPEPPVRELSPANTTQEIRGAFARMSDTAPASLAFFLRCVTQGVWA